jgi:hypothetical protein
MSNYSTILPFPRGQTFLDGAYTGDDNTASHLEGRIYEAVDTVHNTGQMVKLRVVKNDSAGTLTVARRCIRFATTSDTDWGRRAAGFCTTAGEPGKPIDDAYTVGKVLADDDLFYVVEEGFCDLKAGTAVPTISAGVAFQVDGSGYLDDTAPAAGNCIIGRLTEAATASSTTYTVFVTAGFTGGEGT